MPKPNRPKKKKPLIETSDNKTLTSSSFSLFRIGEKRGYPQSSSKDKIQKNPIKKIIKLITTTDSIPSIPFPPLSLR